MTDQAALKRKLSWSCFVNDFVSDATENLVQNEDPNKLAAQGYRGKKSTLQNVILRVEQNLTP